MCPYIATFSFLMNLGCKVFERFRLAWAKKFTYKTHCFSYNHTKMNNNGLFGGKPEKCWGLYLKLKLSEHSSCNLQIQKVHNFYIWNKIAKW